MDFGNQGARTERPYPPFSMNDNSCLSSSRMSRSSLAMVSILQFSLRMLSSKPPLFVRAIGIPSAYREATDMPDGKLSSFAERPGSPQQCLSKFPHVMSETSHDVSRRPAKSHKEAAEVSRHVSCSAGRCISGAGSAPTSFLEYLRRIE